MLQLKRATTRDEIDLCHRIRQTGFKAEYGHDPTIDTDEHDAKPSTFHFLGWVDGDEPTFENCVAVARCFMFNDHEAEIGRVLVLPKWRQRGFGAKLIEFIEETTADVVTKFVIYAFGPKMSFYRRFGFEEDDWKKPEKGHYLYRMHKVRA
ncbi:TPA: hypothetical protein N0F65_007745 [Lagenidium giganteum]|uniref:N-acetyltransferase domain-containing protein n=1 Tax=Lagenidium giganteum TaxID=4803 RepID=A0AAV2Z2X8_9STRA|nr:TPA: hypothetical protein N0F65_007745 [Lagenidium giganteum]